MSYCLNPDCQHPQNLEEAELCENCGSHLLLQVSVAEGELPGIEAAQGIHYRAIAPIGQGGFGRTFLAIHQDDPARSRCVIKQFFPQASSTRDPSKAVELFRQEAIRLEVLGQHSQIPVLFAHLEQDGHQYLVQEFIDGKNLAQELLANGPFNEKQIWQLLKDLLPVLQFVHQHQVIHRDIKPENIIRRQSDRQLVLVDFGAAKLMSRNALGLTGTVIGSAAYTAPEQLRGKAGYASDIYSLGVTCIHLLTQMPPFDLFDSREGNWIWRDYLSHPVSDELGRILDKMIEGAINRRYLSAAQVLQALKPQQRPQTSGSQTFGATSARDAIAPTARENTPLATVSVASPSATLATSSPGTALVLTQNRRGEIQHALQNALADYHVSVQVNQSKDQLTIVLNRSENTRVNYSHLVKVVAHVLNSLQLKNIESVKLFGRIKNQPRAEWKQLLKNNSNSRAIARKSFFRALSTVTQSNFWLDHFKNKNFWIDSLMLMMTIFTFSTRLIIYHPSVSVFIGAAFMAVTHKVSQNPIFLKKHLFIQVVVTFLFFGFGRIPLIATGSFGLIFAALFIASPLLYVQESLGHD